MLYVVLVHDLEAMIDQIDENELSESDRINLLCGGVISHWNSFENPTAEFPNRREEHVVNISSPLQFSMTVCITSSGAWMPFILNRSGEFALRDK